MGKNKLKITIFTVFVALLTMFFSSEISARDYNVSVEKVEGLIYGNSLQNASIIGKSDGVEGEFSFANSDMVLTQIGEIVLEINFKPNDSNEIKKINFTGIVERRKIDIVFDSLIYKQYDGTDSIALPKYSYAGIINNEVSVEGDLTARLSASYVSKDIPIILGGVEIVGEKRYCYYIDFLEYTGTIYPSVLEKPGVNATEITLDQDVFVNVDYNLRVLEYENNTSIDKKYTGFNMYQYGVYDHNNRPIDVSGSFDVVMNLNDNVVKKERLALFELTSTGEYKKLDYNINDGRIYFSIANDSSVIFATRNIEYRLIMLFVAVLGMYLLFLIAYRIKCKLTNKGW